jgi:CubicO group peptidase (beta-lactamase class C family)
MRAGDGLGIFGVALLALATTACPSIGRGETEQRFLPAKASLPADPEVRARLLEKAPRIEAVFGDAFRADAWPGLAVGLVSREGLVWAEGFGVADLETKEPVTQDTVFRVGSITKTVTGLALLALRDEGKLGLDEPVTRTLPEFSGLVYPTHDSPRVTIRHLVTQSSGLSRDGELPGLRAGGHVPNTAELLATLAGQRLEFAPGTSYAYSNQAAAFAGAIVERASGVSFTDFVERRILTPLGMTSSSFVPHPTWGKRLATGYLRTGEVWKKEELTPAGATAATGHLYTTVTDLARFVAFEIDAWPPRDEAETGPVRRSTVRESQLVAGMQPAKPSADGVYWVTESRADVGMVVSHSGTIDGFHAAACFAPQAGVGVIALSNLRTPAGFEVAVRRALDLALEAHPDLDAGEE